MTDRNEKDFYYTLCKLIAKLQDGHGRVRHPRAQGPLKGLWMFLPFGVKGVYLPFGVDWIENQLVVTVSKEPTKVKKGDIIVSIDGINAEQALLDNEKYISGSQQWKRIRALEQFGYGYDGTKANLTIKRGSGIFQIQMERSYKEVIYEPQRPKIDKIKDDIFYVDLNRAEMLDIEGIIDDLTNAKGVIFDLRRFPNSASFELLPHLLREKDTSDAWARVPNTIYPDQENIVGYTDNGWGLEPKEPRIECKVVFLTNARAISAAETYLSFIEHYKLGEILGQPTAGTNGGKNRFQLPGDFTVFWTGMKVLKHDGSQHHLIGVLPTVPVQRTIQGVIEGRDEYLEKALEIINQQAGPR
jgi:C-terminal processing protease CtpA/Prc